MLQNLRPGKTFASGRKAGSRKPVHRCPMIRRAMIGSIGILLLLALAPVSTAKDVVYISVAGEKMIKVLDLSAGGKLTHVSAVTLGGEPGASVVHPNGEILFAAIRSTGKIAAFRIDPKNGSLEEINVIDAGADPAYVSVHPSGRWLFSAYYKAGKVSVHRINGGGRLNAWPAHSVATDTKAHAIEMHPSRTVLVPHTGPNAIYQFRFNERTGLLKPCEPKFTRTAKGTGPRHVAMHPKLNVVYADNEQGSSVTRFELNTEQGTLTARETISTLPANHQGRNTCARAVISRDGRLLFAANRGHNSIAAFRLESESGKITAAGQYPTEETPRGFALSADGLQLVAAGQGSGRVAVYSVEADSSKPVLTPGQMMDVGKRPWWVTIHAID